MELIDIEHARRSGTTLHFLAIKWHEKLLPEAEHAPSFSTLVPSESSFSGGSVRAVSPYFCTSVECGGMEGAAELESLVALARLQASPRFRHVGSGYVALSVD